MNGRNAWLHAYVGRKETSFVIDPTRRCQPAEQLLGPKWSGTLAHDGASIYDGFTLATHQQCLRHLQRRGQALVASAGRNAAY